MLLNNTRITVTLNLILQDLLANLGQLIDSMLTYAEVTVLPKGILQYLVYVVSYHNALYTFQSSVQAMQLPNMLFVSIKTVSTLLHVIQTNRMKVREL